MNKISPMVASNGYCVTPNIETSAFSSMPQRWMQQGSSTHQLHPSVNANQWTSLSAMISYTASKSGQSEYRVERTLADRFNIPNAKCLPANDFDNAILYLADILPL